jgi:hypothetical protein
LQVRARGILVPNKKEKKGKKRKKELSLDYGSHEECDDANPPQNCPSLNDEGYPYQLFDNRVSHALIASRKRGGQAARAHRKDS